MRNILETTNLVATSKAFKSVKRSMRLVTIKRFLEACAALEKKNFRKLKILHETKGRPSVVFIKKPPSEIESILTEDPKLRCSLHDMQMHPPKLLGCSFVLNLLL